MSGRDGWAVMLAVGEFFRPRRAPAEPEEEAPPFVQYRDTTFVPEAPVRASRRFGPGFILSMVGLAIVVSGLFVPWYSYTITGKVWIGNVYYDVYDRDEYTFNGIQSVEERSIPGFTVTNAYFRSWGDYDSQYRNAHQKPSDITGLYSGTVLALVAAITLGALGLLLAALFRLKDRPMLFPALVLVAGALVALAAAGAFGAWHPAAMEEDGVLAHQPDYLTSEPSGPYDSFSGKATRPPLSYEWGPATGWYLALAGPALSVLGAVLLHAQNRGQKG